ncbi:MAG TPA: bifunctional phosphoribosylaminoimidazolecarboxamide formyltransferase/IMP cyclohydrolase [Bacteroidales bacterium]|nr:bifunctional phosphoribosylaminoimidazolecarboxamide formyltransferase/IMP cyclohydrolase [Bacteroidales bacterium]
MREKKIHNALISVYYKDGLDRIIRKLVELGVKIISTGGTHKFISELGVEVEAVEELTSYPSILGGRVKTLHPKIFGGILARRDLKADIEQLKQYDIPEIDLVVVDLYPFEETAASGAGEQEIIEKIDIGGISLIRAAAKNYADTLIISGRDQYDSLYDLLEKREGITTSEERRNFAAHAFKVSSHYDTAIFNYFNIREGLQVFKASQNCGGKLRYGENPHQAGTFYGNFEEILEQLHGKEISYNNLLDIDSAINLIREFDDTTFAILKHNNACGLASRKILSEAWKDALAGDPVSAFGGVLITNVKVDRETAVEINKLFFEVIIAPSYNKEALDILKSKKNRIILVLKNQPSGTGSFRTALNGVLWQEKDLRTERKSDMKTVTARGPSPRELEDLEFANKIVKHSKSNCIVLAGNRQLFGSGVGMTSRVDALKHAVGKAKNFGFDLSKAVMASDAFFPFADSVEIAGKEGITSVIQPGGSVRDNESIEFCNKKGMSMVFTGTRHFRH